MKIQAAKGFPISFMIFMSLFYALLNGLGLWQLERYHAKVNLFEQINENQEAPIVNLEHLLTTSAAQVAVQKEGSSDNVSQAVLENCFYRRVAVEGQFLHDYEMHLYPRTYETQPGVHTSGFHVITPFQMESGGVILINRGWAPIAAGDLNSAISKKFYRPKSSLRLIATLYPLPQKSYFSPKNDIDKNRWFKIDLPEIAQRTSLMTLMPVFAVAEPYTPDGDEQWMPGKYDYPAVLNKVVNVDNKHLEYALTWYILSLILIMMCLYYHQRWYLKHQSVMMGFRELQA